jgi:putative holliday junction resolvase
MTRAADLSPRQGAWVKLEHVRAGAIGTQSQSWQRPYARAKPRFVTARDRTGRTCALDPGKRRVGVAIDDELGLLAHPRGTLEARDAGALLEALRKLADEENVRRFVVGIPLDMRGGEGDGAVRARTFAQQVADATGREVELWDERLSTVQAARSLAASEVRGRQARAKIDEAAACVILQAWIDARDHQSRGA